MNDAESLKPIYKEVYPSKKKGKKDSDPFKKIKDKLKKKSK
jgi:hypothetical protein